MALTAALYNKPPIPLVDVKTGGKIKLQLRRMTFERELFSLPSDMLKLQEMMVEYRGAQNENRYMLVMVYSKLKVHDRFWTSFKFHSEAEYLAYYDLPDGSTLAGWLVMVQLFDKETYTLPGDQILSFMIHYIGKYQSDTDQRKKDYQAVFDRYCKVNESFDKTTFYAAVRSYVEEVYVKPAAESNGISQQEWRRKKEVLTPGKRNRRFTTQASKQKFGPTVEKDFGWTEEKCSACVSKITVIKDSVRYITKLESLIAEKLGKEALPDRPLSLKDLTV
jgi:hypothetical protein